MILLDANILIRAVLGRRVRNLLDEYSSRGVRCFAPDVAHQDAEKYLPSLLEKRGKPASDVLPALQYLRQIIDITPPLSTGFLKADSCRLVGIRGPTRLTNVTMVRARLLNHARDQVDER
jgi:PIN domain-containing protein